MKKKSAKKSPKLMTLPKGDFAFVVSGYWEEGKDAWYFTNDYDRACEIANDKDYFDLNEERFIALVVGKSVEPKPPQTMERVR